MTLLQNTMKSWKIGALLTAMAATGLGVAMAATNPNEQAYRDYAAQRLTQHLQEQECVKLDNSMRSVCNLLDSNEGQKLLKRLVTENTERQNYGLWSIYKTNLSTQNVLPSFLSALIEVPDIAYKAETIGIFGNFQTYRAEQRN